jgi:type III secretion protein L
MAVWLKLGEQALRVEGALLPREEAQALLDMEALWVQTHQEVQAHFGQARRETEQQALQAQQQGYEAGRAQALQEWHALAAQQRAQQQRLHEGLRERLAGMVAQATAQILQQDQADAFFAQALRNLDLLAEQSRALKVTVHPDDLPAAQAALGDQASRWKDGTILKWECAPGLATGTCLCESELGLIDASLQPQLVALQAAAQAAISSMEDFGDEDSYD